MASSERRFTPIQHFLLQRFCRVLEVKRDLEEDHLAPPDGITKGNALRAQRVAIIGAYKDLVNEGLGSNAIRISESIFGPREELPVLGSQEIGQSGTKAGYLAGAFHPSSYEVKKEDSESQRISLEKEFMELFFARYFTQLPTLSPRLIAEHLYESYPEMKEQNIEHFRNVRGEESVAIVSHLTIGDLAEFAKEKSEHFVRERGRSVPESDEFTHASEMAEYWDRLSDIVQAASEMKGKE